MRAALLALFALTAGLGGGFALGRAEAPPAAPSAGQPLAPSPALDSLEARLARARAALVRIPPPVSDEENALRRPRTPSYTEHLRRADSLGVPPVRSEADLARLVRAGRLVPLADTDVYVVRVLEHSKPFVTPATRDALAHVGRRFQATLAEAGAPRYRLVVTSVLRTADLQAALSRQNRNATLGASTHEYGVSVDLVYTRFAHLPAAADTLRLGAADPAGPAAQRLFTDGLAELGPARWQHLYGALTRVLAEAQREGRFLVLLEAEQPVFHLTLSYGA